MRMRILAGLTLAGALLVGLVPTVAAGNPSCTAQFVMVAAHAAQPLGQNVVVPEVRSLSLGGRNVGQEVKVVFATADKSACPPVG
jgi:hypothetical protein